MTLLNACQKNDAKPDGADPSKKSYVKVTFDGQTKTYTDARLGTEGRLNSVVVWDVIAGSSAADYLTISVFSTQAGTYPYRQDLNSYAGVSQVEYKLHGDVFNNYKALVCPTESGYYSTVGQVNVEEYVAGKRAWGTFTGALLDQDADPCTKQGKPFSGEFFLTTEQ